MQITKKCFACKEVKALEQFHKNRKSADGHSGKCKPCAISASKRHRQANLAHYKEYDKARAMRPDRVEMRAKYKLTLQGKASVSNSHKRYAQAFPDRQKARQILNEKVRTGALEPLPCFVCGAVPTEGHHPDYGAALQVVWLCIPHHKEVHRMTDSN